jgi:hypothetical protein
MRSALQIRVTAGPVAVLTAASAFACESPAAPEDIAGTYALERVEADQLPTVLFPNEHVRVRVWPTRSASMPMGLEPGSASGKVSHCRKAWRSRAPCVCRPKGLRVDFATGHRVPMLYASVAGSE